MFRAKLYPTTSVEIPLSSRGGVLYVQNNSNTSVVQVLVENWTAIEEKTIATSVTMKRQESAGNIIITFTGNSGNVSVVFIRLD